MEPRDRERPTGLDRTVSSTSPRRGRQGWPGAGSPLSASRGARGADVCVPRAPSDAAPSGRPVGSGAGRAGTHGHRPLGSARRRRRAAHLRPHRGEPTSVDAARAVLPEDAAPVRKAMLDLLWDRTRRLATTTSPRRRSSPRQHRYQPNHPLALDDLLASSCTYAEAASYRSDVSEVRRQVAPALSEDGATSNPGYPFPLLVVAARTEANARILTLPARRAGSGFRPHGRHRTTRSTSARPGRWRRPAVRYTWPRDWAQRTRRASRPRAWSSTSPAWSIPRSRRSRPAGGPTAQSC
jgi:hypothetical protein